MIASKFTSSTSTKKKSVYALCLHCSDCEYDAYSCLFYYCYFSIKVIVGT